MYCMTKLDVCAQCPHAIRVRDWTYQNGAWNHMRCTLNYQHDTIASFSVSRRENNKIFRDWIIDQTFQPPETCPYMVEHIYVATQWTYQHQYWFRASFIFCYRILNIALSWSEGSTIHGPIYRPVHCLLACFLWVFFSTCFGLVPLAQATLAISIPEEILDFRYNPTKR